MKRFITRVIDSILYRLRFRLKKVMDDVDREALKLAQNRMLSQVPDKGKGVQINGKFFVSHPYLLSLGNNVHIGDNAFLYTDGGLIIGDNTHISRNLTVYTSNHNYEGRALPYDDSRTYKSVHIGRNVWIGMNVSIAPNVKIGEGAIIGLGAVITKDVEPYSIVGNPPYRVIKKRNQQHYQALEAKKLYGGRSGSIADYESLNIRGKSIFDLEDKLFFVVSTGRSGSSTIAKVLSQHPQVTCIHEAKGELVALSTAYEHKEIDRDEVKRRLIQLYSHTSNITSEFYGESDQKISNLIDIYKEIFPKAKFVWLLRNAKDVVSSTYSRGWFADQEFDFPVRNEINVKAVFSNRVYSDNRINGAKISNGFSEEEWMKLTPFERNCWYWAYWNSKIEHSLSEMSKEDFEVVQLESLDENLTKLVQMMNLNDFPLQVSQNNKADYELKTNWSDEDYKAYDTFCKEAMIKWYGNYGL